MGDELVGVSEGIGKAGDALSEVFIGVESGYYEVVDLAHEGDVLEMTLLGPVSDADHMLAVLFRAVVSCGVGTRRLPNI